MYNYIALTLQNVLIETQTFFLLWVQVCTQEEQEILARNSNKSEKLRKKLLGDQPYNANHVLPHAKARQQEGLDKALAHKDKLLEFDKTRWVNIKVF